MASPEKEEGEADSSPPRESPKVWRNPLDVEAATTQDRVKIIRPTKKSAPYSTRDRPRSDDERDDRRTGMLASAAREMPPQHEDYSVPDRNQPRQETPLVRFGATLYDSGREKQDPRASRPRLEYSDTLPSAGPSPRERDRSLPSRPAPHRDERSVLESSRRQSGDHSHSERPRDKDSSHVHYENRERNGRDRDDRYRRDGRDGGREKDRSRERRRDRSRSRPRDIKIHGEKRSESRRRGSPSTSSSRSRHDGEHSSHRESTRYSTSDRVRDHTHSSKRDVDEREHGSSRYRSRSRSTSPRSSKRPRQRSPDRLNSPPWSYPAALPSHANSHHHRDNHRPAADQRWTAEVRQAPVPPRWGGTRYSPRRSPPQIALNGRAQPPLASPSASPPPSPPGDPPGRAVPGTPDDPPPPPPPDDLPPPPPSPGGMRPPSQTPNLSQAPPAPNRNLLDPPSRLGSPKLNPYSPRRAPVRRDDEAEMAAYGKTFVGCGMLGHYDVGRKLGEGTFGVVTRAVHKETKADVALKKIILHNEKDGLPITALREIKILKKMRHPNVVRVLDMVVDREHLGEDGRATIFMVFPYMDHDLCGLLENSDFRNTHSLVKLYMKQLLEGTAYLHANKILHRDMKAANLLINNKGVLMIADFGLARPFSLPKSNAESYGEQPKHSAAEYTNMVVTRWYRPPELLLGETRYGPEIDMWGVGCVFGEMHHRKPILAGESDADQLSTIFRLCGSPDDTNFPGWFDLPGFDGQKKDWSQPTRQRQVMEWALRDGMPRLYADLLDKLLVLNPAKRLTALEALEHPYFYTDPMPSKIGEVPPIDSSHEYTKRKRQAETQAQVQAKMASQPIQAYGRPPPQHFRPPIHPYGPPNAYIPPNGPQGPYGGYQHHQQRPPARHMRPPPMHYNGSHNYPPPNLAAGVPPPSFPLAGGPGGPARPPPSYHGGGGPGVPPPPFALAGGPSRPPARPSNNYQPQPRHNGYGDSQGSSGLDYGAD